MLFVSWDWAEVGKGCQQGLSAPGAAIHTPQVQVDELAVIRLSPIVYNKELVKRVTGSDHPPPHHTPSNQ